MLDIDTIQEAVKSIKGSSALIIMMDGWPGIRIDTSAMKPMKHGFALAPRDHALFLTGFGGLYNVTVEDAHFTRLVHDLVDASLMDLPSLPHGDGYQFQEHSIQAWREEGRRKIVELRRRNGWVEMSDEESNRLWCDFSQRLSFSLDLAHPNRPPLDGVFPLATWDSSLFFKTVHVRDDLEKNARSELLNIFRGMGENILYGMSLNHTCYYFNSNVTSVGSPGIHPDNWPIDVLPYMDYRLISTPQITQGVFTTTHNKRTYAFGSHIVDLLVDNRWPWFGKLLSVKKSSVAKPE